MEAKENTLEAALRHAATDPAARPSFYQALLKSQVYVLSAAADEKEGERSLKKGEEVSLQVWQRTDGTSVVPFFTSLEVLQQSIEQREGYMTLQARDFFTMVKGATLALNPRSKYGKEFTPTEIEALLAGGTNHTLEARPVTKKKEVLLGQPQNYPRELVAALARYFAKRPQVERAYLALMQDTSVRDLPNLVVGIEGIDDLEKIFREAGSVAADMLAKGEAIDFVRVENKDKGGMSAYLVANVKPFYEKEA